MRALILTLFLATAAAQQPCATLAPGADDALIASPANHTLLYEDADIRVLDVHSQPYTREAVHTHRLPSVMYIEQQGAGTYDTPDGKDHRSHPTDPHFKPRVIAIKSEGPHWTENTGDVPFHAIRVEFKHPGCGLAGWQRVTSSPEHAVPSPVLFENDEVRVLDVHVTLGDKDDYSSHPWPGLFYWTADSRGAATAAAIMRTPARDVMVSNAGKPLHLIRFELKYASSTPVPHH